MAYITQYNLKKILKETDIKSVNIKKQLYKSLIDFLSDYEEKELLCIKELLANPDKFFNEYYFPAPKAIDTYQFVEPERNPSYHESKKCERLLADYKNYRIPESIRQQGKDKVLEFREWFGEHGYLIDENPKLFAKKLEIRWRIETALQSLIGKNSGNEFIHETIADIENKIDALLDKSGQFYDESIENAEILDAFKKLTFFWKKPDFENLKTEHDKEVVREVLKKFDMEFKKPINKLLIEYYRMKYNPNLEIDSDYLDWLNFKQCKSCCDSIYTVSQNFKIPDLSSLKINRYEGEMRHGKMDGIGIAYGKHHSFNIIIDGTWKDSHPRTGKITWKTNLQEGPNAEWGELIHGVYNGELSTDYMPHGRGKMEFTFPFNASFDGVFENGKYLQGKYVCENKSMIYEAEWRNGLPTEISNKRIAIARPSNETIINNEVPAFWLKSDWGMGKFFCVVNHWEENTYQALNGKTESFLTPMPDERFSMYNKYALIADREINKIPSLDEFIEKLEMTPFVMLNIEDGGINTPKK